MKTYISPKAKKNLPSKIHGFGLFAIENIKKDEVIVVKVGHVMNLKELKSLPIYDRHAELQIDDDLFIGPKNEAELIESMAYINHSCDPNMGKRGDVISVAMRDIKAGEELVSDYATINDNNNKFNCNCGSLSCRKVISGKDWMLPDLQKKYEGYLSSFIEYKIRKLRVKN